MNKPSIYQMGRVREDHDVVVIFGWGLGLCISACSCHAHPYSGQLSIDRNSQFGTLGLTCHRVDGCDCCTPWTSDELAGMLRDLAAIREIEEITVAEVVEVIEATEAVEVVEEVEGTEGLGS